MAEANVLYSYLKAKADAEGNLQKGEEEHCLPSSSVSSPAMLVIINKMAWATPQQGGVRSDNCQRLARQLMTDFLDVMVKTGGLKIHIRFVEDWTSSWPLSEQVPAHIVLPVDKTGCVLLDPWKAAVDEGNALALHWWNKCVLSHDSWNANKDYVVRLWQLLSSSMEDRACRSLWRQLVWQLGRRIENLVRHARDHGGPEPQPGSSGLVVVAADMAHMLTQPYELDKHLLKYTLSCRDAFGLQCRHLSYCHDKGNCSGMQLEVGAFFTDRNVAVVTCPKAPFVFLLIGEGSVLLVKVLL